MHFRARERADQLTKTNNKDFELAREKIDFSFKDHEIEVNTVSLPSHSFLIQ